MNACRTVCGGDEASLPSGLLVESGDAGQPPGGGGAGTARGPRSGRRSQYRRSGLRTAPPGELMQVRIGILGHATVSGQIRRERRLASVMVGWIVVSVGRWGWQCSSDTPARPEPGKLGQVPASAVERNPP